MTAKALKTLTVGILVFGAILRLILWWTNPPENAYDDHLTPILLIMKTGAVPSPGDCWQCYHPPLFYVFSALAGKAILNLGLDFAKTQQLFSCIFGILMLWVIHLILRQMRIQPWAHVLSLAAVAFLPMHVYISAMHTNDTLSGLGTAVCVYLVIRVLRSRFDPAWSVALGASALLTMYTRIAGISLLPVLFGLCASAPWIAPAVSRRRIAAALVILVLIPMACLMSTFYKNYRDTGAVIPINQNLFDRDGTRYRPGRDRIEFLTFRPWAPVAYPILTEEWVDSYWTVTYGHFWFDVNPFFISYTDPAKPYWSRYKRYLENIDEPPPPHIRLSPLTALCGRGLMLMGLWPLLLCATGMAYAFRRSVPTAHPDPAVPVVRILLLILIVFNIAGNVWGNSHYPIYTGMKGNYYLISVPALAVFLALGVDIASKRRVLRILSTVVFICIFSLVTVHILHIAHSQGRWMWAEALNRRGLELAGQGRPAEAADVYRRIIERDSRYIEVHLNLGNALADLKKPEQAARRFYKALAMDPDHAPIYIHLARVRLEQGHRDEAVLHLQKAIGLEPDNLVARELLDHLNSDRPTLPPVGSMNAGENRP